MARGAHELVARASYGRLLALLAARTGDIASAEDALSEALVDALVKWGDAPPENPDAWLLTAARRRLVDGHRRSRVREQAGDSLAAWLDAAARAEDEDGFPDQRLRLLFVCTHPAIDPAAQVPLMLQTVLGLEATDIASSFRVAPKTMAQRLWRAKTKIREARIPFAPPAPEELPARQSAVLEAIYAAYGAGWEDLGGGETRLRGLTEEALFLARLVVELLPSEPEALGLLALLLFVEARRAARRDHAGAYVPLHLQDPARWSQVLLVEAESVLRRAAQLGQVGPFQIEAALQSAQVSGLRRGELDHPAILALYDALLALAPSLGAAVARAAALLEARGAFEALAALQQLQEAEPDLVRTYQPYWAVRAAALQRARLVEDAVSAYERAIGLSEDPAVRAFLRAQQERARDGNS